MKAMRAFALLGTLFGAFLLASGTASAQDRTIRTTVLPVFEGARSGGDVPFYLTVSNSGADTNATIVVPGDSGEISYPFSLPSGSQKRVLFFSQGVGGYFGASGPELRTDRSRIALKMPEERNSRSESVIGMISDTSGLLGFMQVVSESEKRYGNSMGGQPAYVSPDLAPDRMAAYEFLAALVLGEGAERLNDAQVEAIQRWILAGGSLIISSGANTALLNDPRWQSLLPLRNPSPITIPSLSAIQGYAGGQAPSGRVTIVAGDVATDAVAVKQGDKPVILTRMFGLGAVTLFTFDAFAEPMASFAGNKRLFTRFSRVSEGTVAKHMIRENAYLSAGGYDSFRVYSGPATSTSSGSRRTTNSNPFRVEAPSAERIIWILVAYFAVVVPLNFVVLRLLKRGEWAWVTAPLISLAFAFIFFQFASGLYSSSLSTATAGTLIVDAKSPHAVFVGSSQMFFPRGGGYDLGFKGIEYVRSDLEDYGYGYYGGYGSSSLAESIQVMRPVDVGEIVVNNMRCGNLAFYQFAYAQNFSQRCVLRIESGKKGSRGVVAIRLSNDTPFTLTNVRVSRASWYGMWPDVDIKPGESVEITMQPATERAPTSLARDGWIVEGAIVDGIRPGPQIGEEVNRQGIALVAVPEVKGVKIP